jgi:signal transduction histidine kinase
MFLKKILSRLTHSLSIRLRLTLLFVIVFGSTLITFGVLTFNFVSAALQKEFDDALYNYAVDISESISLDASGDLSVVSPQVDKQKLYPFSLGTALIQIRSITGDILSQEGEFGNFQLPFKRDFFLLSKGDDSSFRTVTKLEGLPSKEAESYRVINFAIDNSPIPQLVLQIAVPMTFLERQIQSRKIFFETTIPLIILIATLAGYFLSTRAMKPVSRMIDKANQIGVLQLSERLPEPPAKDEIRLLAQTLNRMLQRIELAFSSQERFVADASHQLLTPLAIMKAELESQLKTSSAPWIESLLQENELLISLVKNMLLLARVDAGLSALTFTEVHLEDLVLEAIARAEKLSVKKDIRIQFNMSSDLAENSARPSIRADEDLLQNTIFNLLENSIKYSPTGSTVRVLLNWKEQNMTLSIKDEGPGIAENQLELIFNRFSRGSTSSKSAPGYGLGLAIAKKIADLHQAQLWVENNKPVSHENSSGKGVTFHLEIKNI